MYQDSNVQKERLVAGKKLVSTHAERIVHHHPLRRLDSIVLLAKYVANHRSVLENVRLHAQPPRTKKMDSTALTIRNVV